MKVGVLGPLEVREGDRRVQIMSARQRALVALLALDAGQVVSADRLIDGVWGDEAPADALNALQHHISRLRRTVGPSLVTRGSGYLLDLEPGDVDALRFARLAGEGRAALREGHLSEVAATLRGALALWRGAPLEEFLDRDWARREATRLQELYLDAVEDRIDADLSLGLHANVVEELRDVLGEHPFRERLWGQLMLALYRCGRQPEALAAYAEARRVLAEEHGLDPGPELVRLERAILAHDPALAAPESATPRQPAGNLPAPLTSFIGRHEQLPSIRTLLEESRLITLIGPPGVGKTRLAIEVGQAVRQEFPDGVWLVELAPLSDANAIPDTLASLLGRPLGRAVDPHDGAADSALGRLTDHLRSRHCLLILDNCEHLVAGVAGFVAPLLAGCPDLRVLATSRQALGVPGEAQWPVPALSLPAPEVDDPRELMGSEAVRLFEDRAIKVRPSFALTAETAPAVAEVCRRLDGLPLAIELAAARVKALPVQHIANALGDRFRLLVAGSRTVPPRQQTLRAAVDWSYGLLDEDERALFEQLAVFPGGCSLGAAEWVGEQLRLGSFELLDLLEGLVDKSLLVATVGTDGQPRYRMLETLRAYGNQRSQERGTFDLARRRHAGLCATIAEESERGLYGPQHLQWLRRLEEELENLRAAVQNAVAAGDAGTAVRVAGALGFFFAMTERHGMGRAWLEAALATADDSVPVLARARALSSLGYLEGQQSDFDRGIEDAERGLALAIASGDPWQMASSKLILGLTLGEVKRYERMPGLLAEARAGFDSIAEPRADWGVAACALVAAVAAVRSGDLEAAERANREVLIRAQRIRYDLFEAWSRLLAAWIAERRGDLETAVAECRAALESLRRLGLSHYVAFALSVIGRLAMRAGELDRARLLQSTAADVVDVAVSPWFASFTHHGLAVTLWRSGEVDAAETLFRQALAETPATGSEFAALFFIVVGGSPAAGSLLGLGALARLRGELAEAERLQLEGLERAERDEDAAAIALALEGLAGTAAAAREAGRAATLLGAAESVRNTAKVARDQFEADHAARTKAAASSTIGPEALEHSITRGRELPLGAALATAHRA
jgi:predicted ATPase/DNA-binding SARP family transcriptional activator